MHLKIKTKDLALTTIYAALYAALVVVLDPISYRIGSIPRSRLLRPAIANTWILAFWLRDRRFSR